MTREEAIDWLKAISFVSDHNITEAIDMAIEALKDQEQPHICPQCGKVFGECWNLVRCKDCRYKELDGEVTHFFWCRINERPVDDDDFCAWGERKGGDDE